MLIFNNCRKFTEISPVDKIILDRPTNTEYVVSLVSGWAILCMIWGFNQTWIYGAIAHTDYAIEPMVKLCLPEFSNCTRFFFLQLKFYAIGPRLTLNQSQKTKTLFHCYCRLHTCQTCMYLYPKNIFDMWKGHNLEVHCTNIQRNRFIK